jgi:demethylmenaquinone methyltransferase/2-methoxy-6-polyprenyl-1,4-benzoquinol methylase
MGFDDDRLRGGIDKREIFREQQFGKIWSFELNDAFADISRYYDKANHVASLGLWNWFLRKYHSIIELQSNQRTLDVCAGTNAVGLALLRKQPYLEVTALDRSEAMQKIGRESAKKYGSRIECVIGDAHHLPFPDGHFDVVTMQFASRHLQIKDVFCEIKRVLRPGGSFYHCDMLRPSNKLVAISYYTYLKVCLEITSWIFTSGPSAQRQKAYFINTLSQFYSASELTKLLEHLGFKHVAEESVLKGMIGFHRAVKD